MLRQYLVTAQEDLQAKKELVTVKQARLSLAQDEWNHLNSTLSHLSNSTTSCESPFQHQSLSFSLSNFLDVSSSSLNMHPTDGLGHPYPPPDYCGSQVARSPIPNVFQLNSPLSHSTHSCEFSSSIYLHASHIFFGSYLHSALQPLSSHKFTMHVLKDRVT